MALIDLSDGVVHEYGVRQPFVAASTAKVLAAAAYYHLVETGGATLDEPMGDWTAGFQLKEMIQDSDDDSWSLIMDAVGHTELSDYAASIGVSYDPDSNTLTPAEMAGILASLYSGKLLAAETPRSCCPTCRTPTMNRSFPPRYPPASPSSTNTDCWAGNCTTPASSPRAAAAYALAVYTKGEDPGDIPQRTEVIHQLTRAVTDALF